MKTKHPIIMNVWAERDYAVIHVYRDTPDGQVSLAEWRDNDARSLVEDGFLKHLRDTAGMEWLLRERGLLALTERIQKCI